MNKPRLTIDQVRSMVEDIRGTTDDPEDAHHMEDRLYVAVLKEVAAGLDSGVAKKMAREALVADAIEFPRWYA